MIHSIHIRKFRGFEDIEIQLGQYITGIAGQNATGKSTLLGILGHSCELKKKDGVPILMNIFRTEFSEVFKVSKEHDLSGSNIYKIKFSSVQNPNEIISEHTYRVAWQDGGTRYRLIPKDLKTGKERKLEIPTLYLGLRRLFPIGEIHSDDIDIKMPNLKEEEEEWFKEKYIELMNPIEEIKDYRTLNTPIKKAIGISTDKYDYLVNSSGEDNIGQILLAVLSFKRLKDNMQNYQGGLLLIDEIDATLHPAVQINLLKFLIRMAKQLKLQIIFTTHSMTLLEEICFRCKYNNNEHVNPIELIYLTNANIKLERIVNPDIGTIKLDLFNKSTIDLPAKQILVYSEDEETRWFLKKLVPEYIGKVNLLEIKMGCENLIQLRMQDRQYFSKVLFVFDGDVDENKINQFKNVIKLPENRSPEKVLLDYLLNISSDSEHEIWHDPISREQGFSIKTFKGIYREIEKELGNGKVPREVYKEWFNKYLPLFEDIRLYDYWARDFKDHVENFKSKFKDSYNEVATLNSIPKLR